MADTPVGGASSTDKVNIAAQDLAAVTVQENSALDVSGATVTVTDDGNFNIAGEVDTDIDTALQSQATDELRARVFGPDAGGTLQQVIAEELGTAVANTDVGLLTYLARALSSRAQDEVRVASPSALDVSAATVTVDDGGSFAVSSGPLDGALGSNATDHLLVQENSALDVSGATVTVTDDGAFDVNSTSLDGALGSNATDHLLVQENSALDVSAATVTVTDDGAFNIAGTVAVEQQTPVAIEDTGGTQVDPRQQEDYNVEYVSVDLNTNATTTLYDPTNDARVAYVRIPNGGSTAEMQLEVTDGTDTHIIEATAAGGDAIERTHEIYLDAGDTLQVNVTTVEGSSLSETAAVSRSEL